MSTLYSGKEYLFVNKKTVAPVFMKIDLRQFSTGFRWVNFIQDSETGEWKYITIPKFNKLGLSLIGEV